MNKDEIVSKQEIDALLNILDNSGINLEEEKDLNRYNFNKKLLSDSKRYLILQKTHEKLMKILTNKIKQTKKTKIFFELLEVSEIIIERDIDKNFLKFDLNVTNMNMQIKLFISANAINSIVDIYLGGDGFVSQNLELNYIQNSIFKYFLNDLEYSLVKSWDFLNIDGVIELNSISELNKIENISESIKITINFHIGKLNYEIALLYPLAKLEYLILKKENFKQPIVDIEKKLNKIKIIDFNLNFIIAKKYISLEELNSLFINQVITFKKYKNCIEIDNKEFFNFAIQDYTATITKKVNKTDENSQ